MTLFIDVSDFYCQFVDFLPQIQWFKDFHIAAFAEDPTDRLLFGRRGKVTISVPSACGIIMVVDESVFAQGYAPTREGKCKIVRGAFTFIGRGTVIAGTAIILGGDSNKLKALPENLASFQMMTEWIRLDQ